MARLRTSKDGNTLLDALGRPLYDLRISVTDRCNLNCVYCMPDKDITFLSREKILRFEQIERFVRIASELGVKKVKLTGGEPTLRAALDVLIRKILAIDGIEDLGLITNGYFLKSIGYRLWDAGLRRISVSLDAMDDRVFQTIVGGNHAVHPVLGGIRIAEELGFSPIKINCVIQRKLNYNQILPLVEYFRKPSFHLRFIEFMDVGKIDWDKREMVSSKEIYSIINEKYPLIEKEKSYRGEVASRYEYVDAQGEVGFISSVSNPFCRDCSRLRLSADGNLYGCLFAGSGFNIKELLDHEKDDKVIKECLANFWRQRDDRYSELRAEMDEFPDKSNMNYIGG